MTKRFVKRLKLKILCRLAYVVFRLITTTYRIRYINPEFIDRASKLHLRGSFVYGLWHENFFAAVATHPHQNIAPMISRSNDGELISYIGAKLGFKPVRGSTSRGGKEAREEFYRQVDQGLKAAFTADGPRGPRRKLKSGLVDLARSGKMAILPLAINADRKWVFSKSWDQSLIPKPFAKVCVVYGEPITIAAETHGLAFADAKQNVASAINHVADQAASMANQNGM